MVTQERAKLLPTGNSEMDGLLGGGIPLGSLALLEGEPDAGKSVLAQHLTYQALTTGLSVAYYTSENTIKDLMTQMTSLDLDVTDYFLCDRLRVYPLSFTSASDNGATFKRLLDHFESLPVDYRLIVVDALTDLISQSDERHIVDFFAACKGLADLGRAIVTAVLSDSGEDPLLARVRSICDTHLALRLEQSGGSPVRVMEVTKVGDVERPAGNLIGFSVEPGVGIKVASLASSRR